jgi:parvulin-like peptidyl-prolyl isomerase
MGLFWGGCRSKAQNESAGSQVNSAVVATFRGGQVTRAQLEGELSRMPPSIRKQFANEFGRDEFVRSLVDKKLLVAEAERRGLSGDQEIRRQVEALRDRLLVQALVASIKPDKDAAEKELRRHYEEHKRDYRVPARSRFARIFLRATSAEEKAGARRRIDTLARRLRAGESFDRVARDGEGAERLNGGDLGFFEAGEFAKTGNEQVARSLVKVWAPSAVVPTPEGFAILVLVEKRPEHVAAFEEVRPSIEAQLAPTRQQKTMEQLLEKLRREAAIEVTLAGAAEKGGS